MMRGVVLALASLALAGLCAVPAAATDYPLPGKKLAMMAHGSRQMTVFVAKAPLVVLPSPDPTVSGAKLRIVNPTSGESDVIDLPASGWTKNAAGNLFKFGNPSAPGGSSPVKVALVKQKKGIKLVAKATGITLNEPAQESVGLVLAFGRVHYCALFGGKVVQDKPGKFIAKKAPAPDSCPGMPSCGDGILDDNEECESDADCPAQKQCLQCTCLGTGDVQVSLLWSDTNDLDLHVIDPNGEEVDYNNIQSVSGGMLDHDANPGCGSTTTHPVENIFWGIGAAPHGTYEVLVDFYDLCTGGSATPAFTVRTLVDGTLSMFNGTPNPPDQCSTCGPGASLCTCMHVTSFTR